MTIVGGSVFLNRCAQRVAMAEQSRISLERQNSELTRTLVEIEAKNRDLAEQVETQITEIAQLRGKLSQEKRSASIAAHPETENKTELTNVKTPEVEIPASPQFDPASIRAVSWRDLGSMSAENALESFLWSLRTRNPERLVQLVDPADSELLVNDGESIATELAKVTGFRVLNALDVSPAHRMLRLQLDEENGEGKTEEFHFVKIKGQWRFSENAKLAYLKAIEDAKR